MSGAERERLRRAFSGDESYRAGRLLKFAAGAALIGLLALIGANQVDDDRTTLTTMDPAIAGSDGAEVAAP